MSAAHTITIDLEPQHLKTDHIALRMLQCYNSNVTLSYNVWIKFIRPQFLLILARCFSLNVLTFKPRNMLIGLYILW